MSTSSSHRRTRSRREAGLSATPEDIPDAASVSSRGSKRRRVGETPTPDDQAPSAPVPVSEALVNAVIQNLAMPMKIEAAEQHANDKNAREHKEGIKAYAKISGSTWTYYVRTLKINIGRPPDNRGVSPEHVSETVDIDLGPNKIISRQHAIVQYDTDGVGTWQMLVLGRNGAKVDERQVEKGMTIELRSGAVIDIGGVQMMFVLPDQQAMVDPRFIPLGFKEYDRPTSTYAANFPKFNFPPNYSTPAPAAEKKEESTYARGLMLETTDIVDYSQDSAKDLKPPLSYAALIARAILSSPEQKLTLNNIYAYIMENYAFYRHAASGWQNSIRHNLSLNKAFEKIPRRTDEPGKGMKWQIVPEMKEEYIRKLSRPSTRGHRNTSSIPNSPASDAGTIKQSAPFMSSMPLDSSPQRQSLEQLRAAASVRGPALEDSEDISARIKKSTRSVTPPLSYGSVRPVEAYTPDRGSRLPLMRKPDATLTGSPAIATSSNFIRTPGPSALSNAHVSASDQPTLTTAMSPPSRISPYPDDQPTLAAVTPAPQRQHPRLAPPSAGQLPSSYLPTSSPAPFWKYVGWNSNGDFTPTKDLYASSSPPPAPDSIKRNPNARALGSPIREKSESKLGAAGGEETPKPGGKMGEISLEDDDDEDGLGDFQGIDLTKGFQKIGQFHLNGAKAGLGASTRPDDNWGP